MPTTSALTATVGEDPLRILAIHAHPDDETLYTGGTLAAYRAAGAETAVLTCTLGEEGEVIGSTYAQLVVAAGGADQLGGYRIHELTGALQALGAGTPHFLGGAGHFRDSGMLSTPANDHPRAFLGADPEHVADLMACWIRWMRPHIVLVYDDAGTYGHPDHIRAHQCGVRAVHTAAQQADTSVAQLREAGMLADPQWTADYQQRHHTVLTPGESLVVEDDALSAAWDVPLVYWMMQSERRVAAGLADIADAIPAQWTLPAACDIFATDDAAATHTVTLDSAAYAAKVAALQAHATQVTVFQAPEGPVSFAMSNNIAQPLLHTEEFRLVRQSHHVDAADPTDIAAGLAVIKLENDSAEWQPCDESGVSLRPPQTC